MKYISKDRFLIYIILTLWWANNNASVFLYCEFWGKISIFIPQSWKYKFLYNFVVEILFKLDGIKNIQQLFENLKVLMQIIKIEFAISHNVHSENECTILWCIYSFIGMKMQKLKKININVPNCSVKKFIF